MSTLVVTILNFNLRTTLEHIASIQTGVFAKPAAKGEIVYLQARYFDESGQLIRLLHPDLKTDDVNAKHILKPGDVLFAAKGTKNFAAVIEDDPLPTIQLIAFFIRASIFSSLMAIWFQLVVFTDIAFIHKI